MQKFYISHEGRQLGPWEHAEILKKLNVNEIVWTDYLFDEGQNDWVLLMEHAQFAESFKNHSQVKKAEEKKAEPMKNVSKEKEWFTLKGENKYGPFSFVDVVKMLQEKSLFEFDFIWNNTMSAWKRVSEVQEFGAEKIKALKESGLAEVSEVFFRRRHARASYGASLVIHNNKTVWRGQSIELSSGGAGIIIENTELEPGQTLFLHFKAGDGVPPFNAICSVVSKNVMSGKKREAKYGVKFTSISQTIQQAIKTYAEKAA